MRFVGFTLSCFILASCGGTGPQSVGNLQHAPGLNNTRVPSPIAISAAQNAKLICDSTSECPTAVTMIAVAQGNSVSRCAGVLIAENRVLTNAHCVREVDVCSESVFVHFLGRESAVACREIRNPVGGEKVDHPDFAIIELATDVTDRLHMDLSDQPVQKATPYTLFKVDMGSGGENLKASSEPLVGRIGMNQCRATFPTLVYPGIDNDQNFLMTFTDCFLRAGNSGSPIVNSENQVVALAQGYLISSDPSHQRGFFPITVATQARCILEPSLCQSAPPAVGLRSQDFLDRFSRSESVIRQVADWLPLRGGQTDRGWFVRDPGCLSEATPTLRLTVQRFTAKVNQRYEIEWLPELGTQKTVSFQRLPSEGYQYGWGPVQTVELEKCRDLIL